ncbi:2OG-Fe dioxygenase family protein [Algiphilus aromaticivorans]|uniref:2OG-Fe dioxygenase family protein n=1 Tax=Algiphilus aromaticivorans TaxID=382454 RepID=UPI0005C1EE8A|nr:2OG-Fe dioxygenase family protein [Algiphilus aromaticivorans]
MTPSPEIVAALAEHGYIRLPAEEMRARLAEAGVGDTDWQRFAEAWQRMPVDRYMADGGRYRRRRHAVFRVDSDGSSLRLPRQPHYQSRDYNPLNGGIQRWFSPVEADTADGPVTTALLALCAQCFGALTPDTSDWHVEMHQFRIEAARELAGQPTPEGVHRDGVDYVLVTLIGRHNVASGSTHIQGPDGTPLGSFTLTEAGDSVLLDDHRVLHGVTPIVPIDDNSPAWRDALVVTFARQAPKQAG